MKRRPKRNPAVPLFRKTLNATDANQILSINQFSVMNYEDFPHHLGRHFHRKITVIKII
jgi:hypothetical protein